MLRIYKMMTENELPDLCKQLIEHAVDQAGCTNEHDVAQVMFQMIASSLTGLTTVVEKDCIVGTTKQIIEGFTETEFNTKAQFISSTRDKSH